MITNVIDSERGEAVQTLEAGHDRLRDRAGEVERELLELRALAKEHAERIRDGLRGGGGVRDEGGGSLGGGRDGELPDVPVVRLRDVGDVSLHSLKVWQVDDLDGRKRELGAEDSVHGGCIPARGPGRRRRRRLC